MYIYIMRTCTYTHKIIKLKTYTHPTVTLSLYLSHDLSRTLSFHPSI